MKSKRILAVLLSVLLLVGMLPGSVWAQLSADGAAPAEVRTDESSVGEALPEDAAEETAPPDGAQEEAAPPDVTADGAALKAAVEGDYTYDVSDGNATITKYNGAGGAITIPSTLGGYPVTAIGDSVFCLNTSVTSVIVPEGVTSIGKNAFEGCENMTGITLPASLTHVGRLTFNGCAALAEIHICDLAAWCAIDFEDAMANPLVTDAGGNGGFFLNGEAIEDLVIPEGVTSISPHAFQWLTALKSVTFPASLETIGQASFSVTGLTELTIPGTVKTVGPTAFNNCAALKTATLEQGVETVGLYAFAGCAELESVTLPASIRSIGGFTFLLCSSLRDVYYYGSANEWALVGKDANWDAQTPEDMTVHVLATVAVSAAPTDGGTVAGGCTAFTGTGTEVTVTATPATGYLFVNWTEGDTAVSTDAEYTFTLTGDRTLTAHFEKQKFTVTFVNDDGTELQSSEVEYGQTPVYTGETPTKASTAQYSYTFSGWTPEIVPVTAAATYTATYTGTLNKYTVTFETNGGSAIAPVTVEYGQTVDEPEAPVKAGFDFTGWYADEELTQPFDFTAAIVADTTVYAAWEEVTYPAADGSELEWTKGSGEDVTVTVKRSRADETCFEHFTGVELDGAMLADGTDYTAKAGSTVVTLKAETLEKLSVGAHTLSILFDDGEAELTLTVKEKPVSPKTGDCAQLLFWLAVTAADVLALGAIALLRRKKTRA